MGGQGTGDGSPRLARVAQQAEVPAALDTLGVPRPRPVLLMVGGAGGMDEAARQALAGSSAMRSYRPSSGTGRSSSTAAPTPG